MKDKKEQILVIGYGNTLRCDDGVGQSVALETEQWDLPQVRSLYLHQLTPELAETIAQFETVIFIDASIETETVKLSKIENLITNNNWTHHLNPQSIIYLTDFLYQKIPQVWLITIPIKKIDFGEDLSNFAQKGKKEALITIQNLIQQILKAKKPKICMK